MKAFALLVVVAALAGCQSGGSDQYADKAPPASSDAVPGGTNPNKAAPGSLGQSGRAQPAAKPPGVN